MKKKSLTKRLALNKEKISTLNYDEMIKVKGASALVLCSESCSVLVICCGPTAEKNNVVNPPIKGQ